MNQGESQNDRQIRTIGELDRIRFNPDGLVPVISQHRESGEVLMLAWANRQALEETLATRIMHFWSRSRDSLWQKGETSGNTQSLVSLHLDCDGDALLARVNPVGPACHTGDRSCFGLDSSPDAPEGTGTSDRSTVDELAEIVAARDRDRPDGSYTTRLLEDENLRLKKLGEEVSELIVSLARGGEGAPEEAADLVYHMIVALQGAGRPWDEVEEALARRRR